LSIVVRKEREKGKKGEVQSKIDDVKPHFLKKSGFD